MDTIETISYIFDSMTKDIIINTDLKNVDNINSLITKYKKNILEVLVSSNTDSSHLYENLRRRDILINIFHDQPIEFDP